VETGFSEKIMLKQTDDIMFGSSDQNMI